MTGRPWPGSIRGDRVPDEREWTVILDGTQPTTGSGSSGQDGKGPRR